MESKFVKSGCGCSGLSGADTGCGCSGLSESPVMTTEEQEKAKKTDEDAVETAARYSNENIPLPLKLTGIALIIYIITR